MNTNTALTSVIRTLIVGVRLIASVSPAVADLAIIGEKGQVLFFSSSGGTGALTSAVESVPHGRPITESYFAVSEDKLFASDDTGKLYELDLRAASNGYQRIDTEQDLVSCTVWYDSKEKRPAWLHLMDKKSAAHVRFRGKDNILRKSQNDDIVFRNRFVFGMHIDGWKSTVFLVERYPELALLTKNYLNDQWIIIGRSKTITAYACKPVRAVKDGERLKVTLLFHNQKQNKWRMESLDEYGEVTVFDDVALIRGIHKVKGAKDPNGNEIQARPSGKWYFYVPENHGILAYELDPSLIVQYATAREAIISGDSHVLTLRLGDRDQNEAELLVELPPGFSVSGICSF